MAYLAAPVNAPDTITLAQYLSRCYIEGTAGEHLALRITLTPTLEPNTTLTILDAPKLTLPSTGKLIIQGLQNDWARNMPTLQLYTARFYINNLLQATVRTLPTTLLTSHRSGATPIDHANTLLTALHPTHQRITTNSRPQIAITHLAQPNTPPTLRIALRHLPTSATQPATLALDPTHLQATHLLRRTGTPPLTIYNINLPDILKKYSTHITTPLALLLHIDNKPLTLHIDHTAAHHIAFENTYRATDLLPVETITHHYQPHHDHLSLGSEYQALPPTHDHTLTILTPPLTQAERLAAAQLLHSTHTTLDQQKVIITSGELETNFDDLNTEFRLRLTLRLYPQARAYQPS